MSMRIYFNDEIEDVNVGDEVSTTTSTFDYDNVAGTFAKGSHGVIIITKIAKKDKPIL